MRPVAWRWWRRTLHMRAWRSRQARPRRRAASAATDAGAAGAVCALMTAASAGKRLLRLTQANKRARMQAQRGHPRKPRPRQERDAAIPEPVCVIVWPCGCSPKRGSLPRAQPTEKHFATLSGITHESDSSPCVKVPGSSRVPAPPWVGSRSPDGWDQIPYRRGRCHPLE